MKILITAGLLLFSTSLLASGLFGGGDTTNIHNTPIAVGGTGIGGAGGKGGDARAKAAADARALAVSAAKADANAKAVALQKQKAEANNAGNHQTIKFDAKHNTPALGGLSSGNCSGLSAQLVFAGFGGGIGTESKPCNDRLAADLGMHWGTKLIATGHPDLEVKGTAMLNSAFDIYMNLESVTDVTPEPAVGGGEDDGIPANIDLSGITYDSDGDAWKNGKLL